MNRLVDDLSRLVAAASGRAATALAEMSRQSVNLAIPSATMARAEELHGALCQRFVAGLTRVTLPFSGGISGTAILILGIPSAKELARIVHSATGAGGFTEDEVLVEVGSVLLNACIGTYAGLIPGRVLFGVPQIQHAGPGLATADLLRFGPAEESLWVETGFQMQRDTISGLMVVCAPVETLHTLLAAIGPPFAAGEKTTVGPRAAPEKRLGLRPILITDDEEDDVFLLQRRLLRAGVLNPIMVFRNGEELMHFFAQAIARPEEKPFLLLLDLRMPMLDGFDVLASLRAEPKSQRLPVVVITSSNRAIDRDRAMGAGANEFLVKFPSDLELASVVMRASRHPFFSE